MAILGLTQSTVRLFNWMKSKPLPLFLSSPISTSVSPNSREILQMGGENLSLIQRRNHANPRLINVSGYKTDLLEIHSQDPKLHILFIPGNPGVVSFYTDFLESLYELLSGAASVTAICHLSHSRESWEPGKLFSLQEQIDHKMSFIEQEFQDNEVPLVLVSHSIGSYISLELLRRLQEKVAYCVCLYPFLAVNTLSSEQSSIRRIAASPALCKAISSIGALFGMLPPQISTFLVKKSIGKSWSSSAVEALRTHVLQYHSLRNILFMAKTEFEKMTGKPDWDFIREKKSKIAFMFGLDDHWGPLHLYEEIRKQVPDIHLTIEREGHSHSFSCSEAGSIWVAQHVSTLINNYFDKC
ncbi:hypothetical protein ACJIZ3_021749 [Penstemon smallii]|uniref:Lipid droplet-associated hydrolase n=1 Tax=Penstemon smallii TaxID=265156 RepID=A0ABD3SMJ8_9LAMI